MRRFCYDRPNESWQSDWTEWHLGDGTSVVIAGTIDDHSRYLCALASDTGDATTTLVWQAMLAGIIECGVPSMSLTDNGFVYTGKHRGFETPLEKNLRALGTRTINSRLYHPQTCGKITRQKVNPAQGKITVGPYFAQVGNQWGGHTFDAICDDNHIVIFSGTTVVREFDADPGRRYQGQRRIPGTHGKRQPLPAA